MSVTPLIGDSLAPRPQQDAPPDQSSPGWGWRLGVGLVPSVVGASSAVMSWHLGLWTEGLPGPGFYPMFASLVILAGGVFLLIRQDPLEVEPAMEGESRRVLLGVGILLVYSAGFMSLGVVSTSVLTCLLWLKLLAGQSWISSLAISAAAGVTVYVLFIRLLQLPLPLDAFLGR